MINCTVEKIKIRDLIKNYCNNAEEGVFGYDRRLAIRPPYQREFVYKPAQSAKVIETIIQEMSLGLFYWIVNIDANGNETYEVLDGQQRTISICEYFTNNSSPNFDKKDLELYGMQTLGKFDGINFETAGEMAAHLLDYEILVAKVRCEDTQQKTELFKRINIAGEPLTTQEIRNAVFANEFTADAKAYFSKTGCTATTGFYDKYISGTPIRQEIFETALDWAQMNDDDPGTHDIDSYMRKHSKDTNAQELKSIYQEILGWAHSMFGDDLERLTKKAKWGELYRDYGKNKYRERDMEAEAKKLLKDDEVTKKSGIIEYLLSGNEKFLSLRAFKEDDMIRKYDEQKGICPLCGRHFGDHKKMHGDHIKPWSLGGKTTYDNLQMLCPECNIKKSNQDFSED